MPTTLDSSNGMINVKDQHNEKVIKPHPQIGKMKNGVEISPSQQQKQKHLEVWGNIVEVASMK